VLDDLLMPGERHLSLRKHAAAVVPQHQAQLLLLLHRLLLRLLLQ
jgi:hypothetical protein